MNIAERIEAFDKLKPELKKEFEEYVRNKTIPLDERWKVYLKSGGQFSRTESSIYHGLDFIFGESIDSNGYVRKHLWHEDEQYDRYRTLSMVDVVSMFKGQIAYIAEGKIDKYSKYLTEYQCFKEPDILYRVKEQILEDNIWAFVFDW